MEERIITISQKKLCETCAQAVKNVADSFTGVSGSTDANMLLLLNGMALAAEINHLLFPDKDGAK
jgi:hypothetical protein